MRSKIFVVELDGGTWDVILPLIKQGKLPYFKRLIENGAWGDLMSDQPMISPRIWTSIFSGKHSTKHGVEFFGDTSNAVRQKRIWDIFNDSGNKVGVMGSLVTWPPYPINGFIIPSIFSITPETYPQEYSFFQGIVLNERKKLLQQDVRRRNKVKELLSATYNLRNHGISNDTFFSAFKYMFWQNIVHRSRLDRYWRKATLYHKMLTDMCVYLYKKYGPDFITFHIHLCDALSHRYWEFHEPSQFPETPKRKIKKYSEVIANSYIEVDQTIGKFINMMDPNTKLIVVSDHGFGALPSAIQPHVLDIDKFLKILGLENKVIPARFGIKVFLTFAKRDKDEMKKTMDIIDKIVFKDSGERLFKTELSERYISISTIPKLWRTHVQDDLLVIVGTYGAYTFKELFPKRKLKITGIHKEKGIMIFYGQDIREGTRLKPASVFDITPTLLTLAGYPAAKDMDGKVILEIFKDKYLESNPVTYVDTYENEKKDFKEEEEPLDYSKIKDRLETLGYI